ncbi:hypothetical protein QOZ80_6AG0529470 [Eleusine coracana subsp. coracana]|nr:hypothetical protein QOZ80_6AG0529470 [Eleusine coracana subsp. coracana]
MASARTRSKIRSYKKKKKKKNKKKKEARIKMMMMKKKIIKNNKAPVPQVKVSLANRTCTDVPTNSQEAIQPHKLQDDMAQEICRDNNPPCSICGGRPHNEYFCPYNYMFGCFSVRTCREQCSPGRHDAMASADSCRDSLLRRFVRVSNVPFILSEMEVHRLFQRFGPLRACAVTRVGPQGGVGFVTFHNHEHAEAAVGELNGHRVGDSKLRVDWAYPRTCSTRMKAAMVRDDS